MSSIPNSYIDDIRRIVQSILNQLEHLKVRWLTGVERINNAEWSDVNYGITVCTSTTRPTAYDGRTIYETDTDRQLVYNGASWVSAGGTDYAQGAQVSSQGSSVADDTPTIAVWLYTHWDTDNIFDTPTYYDRLICKTEGKYLISATGKFIDGTVGECRMRILHTTSISTYAIADITRTIITSNGTDLQLHQIVHMDVDEYVRVEVTQKSGGPQLFKRIYPLTPSFTMQRLPG